MAIDFERYLERTSSTNPIDLGEDSDFIINDIGKENIDKQKILSYKEEIISLTRQYDYYTNVLTNISYSNTFDLDLQNSIDYQKLLTRNIEIDNLKRKLIGEVIKLLSEEERIVLRNLSQFYKLPFPNIVEHYILCDCDMEILKEELKPKKKRRFRKKDK